MSFIEGIGDDFLYLFGFLFFIGIVSLAWLSTHVNYINFPTTLFIIERRTHRRNEEESEQAISNSSSGLSPSNEHEIPSTNVNETQTEHDSEHELSEAEEYNSERARLTAESNISQTQQSQCSHTNTLETNNRQETTSDEQENQSLRVVIKFLNDTKKEISANSNDTIFSIKQLYFADELANNEIVRFIYQGRELQDRETLRSYNIRDQTTIHCHISARRHDSTSQRNDGISGINSNRNEFDASTILNSSPINLSSYFVLLLSLFLGLLWYLRIKYRVLFSPVSTASLVLITIIFLTMTCGTFFAARRQLSSTRQATTIAITPNQHVHLD